MSHWKTLDSVVFVVETNPPQTLSLSLTIFYTQTSATKICKETVKMILYIRENG
jgi:hypothetical protein